MLIFDFQVSIFSLGNLKFEIRNSTLEIAFVLSPEPSWQVFERLLV